jgi:pyruvate kinase
MAKIAEEAEKGFLRAAGGSACNRWKRVDESEAIARAACSLAETIDAKALVIATQNGRHRPAGRQDPPAQTNLAGTTEPDAFRAPALVRGVRPMMIQPVDLLIHLFEEMQPRGQGNRRREDGRFRRLHGRLPAGQDRREQPHQGRNRPVVRPGGQSARAALPSRPRARIL